MDVNLHEPFFFSFGRRREYLSLRYQAMCSKIDFVPPAVHK